MDQQKLNIGIIGFGGYIPQYRIKTEEIAAATNNHDAATIVNSLLIEEKAVPNKDEDTITISVQSAKNAVERANINKNDIGAIYIGSESHPYAVKPSSTIVAQALGMSNQFTTADTQFACKAGTASLQIVAALVKAGMIKYGLAIGSDTAQSKPGDFLEFSAGCGSAAILLGNNEQETAAFIQYTHSITSNTPDFWRRQNQNHPEHAGRFTGEPAYFHHIITTTTKLLEKTDHKITDFQHVILHQPNGKFPLVAAKKLNITNQQLKYGMLVNKIGNCYAASALLGLVNVLEHALPNEKILLTSYGSGAGSDSFIIETTEQITEKQKKAKLLKEYIAKKEYINYNQYRKAMEQIV